jgi:hypothetical protein
VSQVGQPYQPPEQSRRGQLVDAITILLLIFATLFATTYIGQSQTDTATSDAARPVARLPVNPTERAQYQRLVDTGTTDLATVNSAVDTTADRADKYQINVWALIGTAALLAIYLGLVYRVSFREYQEVIEERFGPRPDRDRS